MTNHDRFVEALKDMGGKELSTSAIKTIILQKFPDMNFGSILPNDHAGGNKSPCWCANTEKRIFDRISRGMYKVRVNLSSQAPSPEDKTLQLGKSGDRVTKLWNSHIKGEWEAALDEYWNHIKPENRALEEKLNNLNVKKSLDIKDWYSFLRDEFILWKYDPHRRKRITRLFTEEYMEDHKKLNEIIEELFKFDCKDIKRGLDLAEEIKGFGVGGASGLLSLLFPKYFGTVDQFVVKALQNTKTFPEGEFTSGEVQALPRMNPENLSKSEGVILIQVMRRKADNLNSILNSRFWTPRKIDMILWALGHDK